MNESTAKKIQQLGNLAGQIYYWFEKGFWIGKNKESEEAQIKERGQKFGR